MLAKASCLADRVGGRPVVDGAMTGAGAGAGMKYKYVAVVVRHGIG